MTRTKALIVLLILIVIIIGGFANSYSNYQESIPEDVFRAGNDRIEISINASAMTIFALQNNISGKYDETAWNYGSFLIYLAENGDACLGGGGSSSNFSLNAGQKAVYPIIHTNVEYAPTGLHGKQVMPKKIVQTFTVENLTVSRRF